MCRIKEMQGNYFYRNWVEYLITPVKQLLNDLENVFSFQDLLNSLVAPRELEISFYSILDGTHQLYRNSVDNTGAVPRN